jgi:hypothetical protein
MKKPGFGPETGAALLTVLMVLTIMGIVVAILLERTRSGIRPWALETERTQATYAAESGIAFQLYLERFSDSTDPDMDTAKSSEEMDAFSKPKAEAETFSYHMDSTEQIPIVTVDRTRAYLDITSKGRYRKTEVTLFARFGKALDDSVFGPALTLENTVTLDPFPAENINGPIRLMLPTPTINSQPWPAGFSIVSYANEFTNKKYYALESALQKKLGEEGGQSGNGSFSPSDPPIFSKQQGGDLFFPLGQVDIVNDRDETWVIRGPGRIFSDGEIRIRGHIRLENIQLFSGKNITFEDSISGEENSAFARGSIFLHDKCHIGLEALAGKDILLRDRSQTTIGSVLITVGNKHLTKGADTLNAIRVVNQAIGRGFFIAAGPNGRLVLGTSANIIEGVVMASSVWLAGEVHGPVLTQKLLCEGTHLHNCLGTGKIDRAKLPAGFVQPLQLGPGDRKKFTFKLMEWRRS